MRKVLTVLLLAVFVYGCTTTPEREKDYQATRTVLPDLTTDSTALLLADSIIYDVVLAPADSTNDWEVFRLRKVDENMLATQVFESIYAGKLQAYDYETEEPLTIEAVRELEKDAENQRNLVRKMQFEEQWFFDQATTQFVKKVTAIMLAYEIKAEEGRYKAGVKVYFK